MDTLWSKLEAVVSSGTLDVVREHVEVGMRLVVKVCKGHKLVLIGAGSVVGLYWYVTWTHGHFKKLNIPGPKPGFLGILKEFKKKGIAETDLDLVKTYGKVVGVFHARTPVLLLADADMIREITVKNFTDFTDRTKHTRPREPILKHALTILEGDHWRFMRSVLSPTFTSGRMREMVPLIQKCVDTLIDKIHALSEGEHKSIEVKDLFSRFTTDAITSTSFGVETDCQNETDGDVMKYIALALKPTFRTYAVFILCAMFPFLLPVFEKVGVRMMKKEAADYFLSTVYSDIDDRQKLNRSRKDLLQLMLNSHRLEVEKDDDDWDTRVQFDSSKRRGLTKAEILSNCIVFLLAGYETTSLSLTFMSYLLATNQDCQERLIQEIDTVLKGEQPDYDNVQKLQYLENVFLETLRIFPPARRTNRVSGRDTVVNGYRIQKNTFVSISITAVHNNTDYWINPREFNPDRFLPENRPDNFSYVFLPFGCIGKRLAQMEAKMAMAAVLQHFRLKTGPETEIPPHLDKGVFTKPVNGVRLRFVRRD